MSDGARGGGRGGAGQGDDAADLFGGEGGRCAGTGSVGEQRGDAGEESGNSFTGGLGRAQRGDGGQPAVTPGADGQAAEAELAGDAADMGVVGQGEDDAHALDEAMGLGGPPRHPFQEGAVQGREPDGARSRTRH